MGSVIIRNLDDDTIARLKERAMEQGTSLEQFLRDRLSEMSLPTRERFLAKARAIRARSKPSDISVVEDVRAWRDGHDDVEWAGPPD